MVLENLSVPSLYIVKSIIILDNDGNRIFAKYYNQSISTIKEQKEFEKSLFNKTHKGTGDVILLDNWTVVYRNNVDLIFYVMGSINENELMLNAVLACLFDALNAMLRKNVEKRILYENLDLVILTVDEICDDGIILESDPIMVMQRVQIRQDDVPLGEQTVSQKQQENDILMCLLLFPIMINSPGIRDLRRKERIKLGIEIAGFWFLGLCNNFGYVVMLSAAHDILKEEQHENSTDPSPHNTTNRFDCNHVSAGAVLLADILPALAIKVTAPFFMHKIIYNIRFAFIVLFAASSLLIVGTSNIIALSLFGVACASISSGFGEITILQLSSFYSIHTVSAWSSGTGAAGLLGSLSYALLTGPIKLKPKSAILVLLFIPVIQLISYFMVGASTAASKQQQYQQIADHSKDETTDDDDEKPARDEVAVLENRPSRLQLIKPLIKYIIPLTLVYFAEYLINQGLYELIFFHGIFLSHASQYRWYSGIYQIGVFISRTSVIFFRIHYLWLLPIIQFINLGLFFACVYRTEYIPSIWLVFGLILFEGLIGGGAYVNTFYKISKEIPERDREFSMGVASVGDSFGITFAGLLAIPIHNAICQ
ncbi:unnamed protein product [Adineta ricciae]|uniref:Battenin n=1 Tax=Adineta ricciae TaxID=249248 RepID=A0A814MN29_ADIRI|nr:unnamed protein product [Adineta ricciae]